MYVSGDFDSRAADTARRKAAWEVALRLRLGLPRHSTSNDGAVALVRVALLMALTAAVLLTCCPWPVGLAAVASASAFAGIGLQQYAWYTSCIFSECWADEGLPVAAVALISSLLLGGVSLLLWVLLGGVTRLLLLGALHAGLLTSHRWAFWGSLFDGNEKRQRDDRRRR